MKHYIKYNQNILLERKLILERLREARRAQIAYRRLFGKTSDAFILTGVYSLLNLTLLIMELRTDQILKPPKIMKQLKNIQFD